MEFHYRNVNQAFFSMCSKFNDPIFCRDYTIDTDSRAGRVRQITQPVMLSYSDPTGNVLIHQERDCNPFFHFYEAMWMLAGRNDVEPLKYYSSKIGDIASDDGKIFNGAYGHRWRHHGARYSEYEGALVTDRHGGPGYNQLGVLIDHLTKTPNSRRAVLQMWNVEDDLSKVNNSKDVCCNLSVLFSIDREHLDMTVLNRSNDLIWGMLGANAVHFWLLMEYVATKLDKHIGTYTQFTNNCHVYLDRFEYDKWFPDPRVYVPYDDFLTKRVYMKDNFKHFDEELQSFVSNNYNTQPVSPDRWSCSYFKEFQPLLNVFHARKAGQLPQPHLDNVKDGMWGHAASLWLGKRNRI